MSLVTQNARNIRCIVNAVALTCDRVRHCPWAWLQLHTSFTRRYYSSKHFKRISVDSHLVMEKNEVPHLRHLKYRDKIGGKFPIPSIIEVQVVGNGGRGLPKAVLLTTDHSKYLFNCGEGTQRITSEFRMKLSKLSNIFVTHMNWDNVGGLLGMGLTLEGMKVPKITIHGPPGVENVAMMAKGFAESTSLVIEKKELGDGHFEDSALKIDYVPFCKKGFDLEKLQQLFKEKESQQPAPKRHKMEPVENAVAVTYVCWPHPPQRRILLEKCVDLGLEKGPMLARLKDEESVTLENGTVIYPDQVLSDPEIAQPILIVDCPSDDYLDSLLSNQQLSSHQDCGEDDVRNPVLVVHMTPLQVFQTPAYQQWMGRFNSGTKHMVLNELMSEVAFEGVYRYQSQLNLVHPTIFPHLRHLPLEDWPQAVQGSGFRGGMLEGLADQDNVVAGCTNLIYHYRKRLGVSREQCVQLDHKSYVTEALQQPETEKVLNELRHNAPTSNDDQDSTSADADSGHSYPCLTFLGTGSSIPSKSRNVSGLLVHLRHDATLILDCGEGTSGQLYRHFGSQTAEVLRNLKAIFVSHLHADHHMGLFNLLRDRIAALEAAGEEVTPILLLAPIQMARWLQFYHNQVEPVKELIRHVPLQKLLPQALEEPEDEAVYEEILQQVALTEFLPVEVAHCPNAFGVSLTHTDGWKLVFSGDTMPCQRLVTAGKDCDILVHEATHEDDLKEEARMKRHSTVSQAIDIGQQMGAKFILLNHFSQRYAKIPFFKEAVPENVGIAFDNMSVSRKELPLLPHFIPVLKTLFAEEHAELQATTSKRLRKKAMKEKISATMKEKMSTKS